MSLIKPPIIVVFRTKIIFLSSHIFSLKLKNHITTHARVHYNLGNLFKSKLKINNELVMHKKKYYYQCISFEFERKKY